MRRLAWPVVPLAAVWVPLPAALLVAVLAVLVAVFGRFERPPAGSGRGGRLAVAVATGLVGLGLLGLTANGFAPYGVGSLPGGPSLPVAALGLGLALTYGRARSGPGPDAARARQAAAG